MNILRAFDEQPFAKALARRSDNFKRMCAWAYEKPHSFIIETGTAWDQGNWEGQGQSTLVWDWLISQKPGIQAISIDIRKEAIETAKKQTHHIGYLCGDSVVELSELPDAFVTNASILYLDSLDWSPEMNIRSSLHHLCELTAVWAKLPKGCLICVDDRHGNDTGKHIMVESFMEHIGLKPIFKNHQIGWIK